ncbi:hypothetical protein [Nitrobacter hamburgensis]|uniref:hypothetical protein n=1 Tax=Nitrobacter hamburgensis TaxID=912 RepID=UPI0002F8E570|nr:hypothetical protein [Nitrobacter hamburgensis]
MDADAVHDLNREPASERLNYEIDSAMICNEPEDVGLIFKAKVINSHLQFPIFHLR